VDLSFPLQQQQYTLNHPLPNHFIHEPQVTRPHQRHVCTGIHYDKTLGSTARWCGRDVCRLDNYSIACHLLTYILLIVYFIKWFSLPRQIKQSY